MANVKYSPATKSNALKEFYDPASRGYHNYRQTARICNLPDHTVRFWDYSFKNGELRLPEVTKFLNQLKDEGAYVERKKRARVKSKRRLKKTRLKDIRENAERIAYERRRPQAGVGSDGKALPLDPRAIRRSNLPVETLLSENPIEDQQRTIKDQERTILTLMEQVGRLNKDLRKAKHDLADLTRLMRGMAQHIRR